jgi:hypothetical protein
MEWIYSPNARSACSCGVDGEGRAVSVDSRTGTGDRVSMRSPDGTEILSELPEGTGDRDLFDNVSWS